MSQSSRGGIKYTCLLYGEGKGDKKFIANLTCLENFKFHNSKWAFSNRNASGECPEAVLTKCSIESCGIDYDLKICFIDLDVVKSQIKKVKGKKIKWQDEKVRLEEKAKQNNIVIFWQIDNAEQEYAMVLGELNCKKGEINKLAMKNIEKFIGSDYYKRLLKVIGDMEENLKLDELKQIDNESIL